jgi:2-isopropylmalate synthase
VLVSDLGGRAGMAMKAKEFGVDLDDRAAAALSQSVAELESQGFVFEAADASLELLMRRATGWEQQWFSIEGYRVTTYHRSTGVETEATVKVLVGDDRRIAVGEGNGPVNALDAALRSALNGSFPVLEQVHLTDYKVRILDDNADTSAVTRVLIESSNGTDIWTTVGVSTNIIEASWMALVDSLVFGLLLADK